jgi:hypothetical protein
LSEVGPELKQVVTEACICTVKANFLPSSSTRVLDQVDVLHTIEKSTEIPGFKIVHADRVNGNGPLVVDMREQETGCRCKAVIPWETLPL